MAVPKEGVDGQHSTHRKLKNEATRDGTNPMNTAGGSFRHKSKRTLKAQKGVRDTTTTSGIS